MEICKELAWCGIPQLELEDLVQCGAHGTLSPLLANICRQWFWFSILVPSTAVPLQEAVPHCRMHDLCSCPFKYLSMVLGHQWGPNGWKASTIPLTKYFVFQHHWTFQRSQGWQSCQKIYFVFELQLKYNSKYKACLNSCISLCYLGLIISYTLWAYKSLT